MGDLIKEALRSALVFAPPRAIASTLASIADPYERAALFADICRLNALYMIARAGSGHIGSSFSSLDLVSHLLLYELGPDDVYFSSKGHDAPGLYAAWIGLGKLPAEMLHQLRRLGGLPGHPDVGTANVAANTGSLGMGVSKAKGMVLAQRQRGEQRRVFVLLGDGELQEGQIWESLQGAALHGMHELTAIVDHNRMQSDRAVAVTSDLGDLLTKLRSFGWAAERVDGHDLRAIGAALERLRTRSGPQLLLAETIKGRGVSFMEHTALADPQALYRYHSGAPDAESYERAVAELGARIDARIGAQRGTPLVLERVDVPDTPAREPSTGETEPQRLIPAYGRALLAHAQRDPRIIALDADLMVDMGLLPFARALPDRFVECGIAEMDMVSQAGGLALRGMRPVCHSFACFMTTRANEQIFNNATERTQVIYTGGLAGLLPAAPGHSHQSLRDISILGAIPGLELIQPCDERDVELAVDYAFTRAPGSCYLRLCSVPVRLPCALPERSALEPGRGVIARRGEHGSLIAYGPVLLAEALRAALLFEAEHRRSLQVVTLPWLNRLDLPWLLDVLGGRRWLFTLDDHFTHGGQGDLIWSRLAEAGSSVIGTRFGVDGIPACGENARVLQHHGLDAASLCVRIAARMKLS